MPTKVPTELTDAQADVWRATLAALPDHWLMPSATALLIEYCRHVCRSRMLEIQLQAFDTEWLKAEGGIQRLDKLLGMADRETRAIMNCAKALRLSPQAIFLPAHAGRRYADTMMGPAPWDIDNE